MPSKHIIAASDLALHAPEEICIALRGAGITPYSVQLRCDEECAPNCVEVVVVEDGVSVDTIKSAVASASPIARLTANSPDVFVPGDGVSTIVLDIDDSRGAAVAGRVCKYRLQPGVMMLPLVSQGPFNGSGRATFVVGPSPSPGVSAGPVLVEFYHDPDDAVRARAMISFVS